VGLVLGLDEAGRGPVLGPLVICGYVIGDGDEGALRKMGVADSKVLSPEERSRLAPLLRKAAVRVVMRVIAPAEVDHAVNGGGLNQLEVREFVSIIREVAPDTVQLDALTSRPGRFGRLIGELVRPLKPVMVSENRADSRYPAVQAASVLAKVERDAAISALQAGYGDVGSGYPNDPLTKAFLKGCDPRNYPPCVRRSWKTVAR